jgi:acetyltransferase-like isoleucine patch superfamily enzyme
MNNNLKKLIPSWLKPFIFTVLKLYFSLKYGVKLGKRVWVNLETKFEGSSVVYSNNDLRGSFLGFGSYIAPNSDTSNTIIGRFCSIGSNVRTCLGMHPVEKFVSTHPAFFSVSKEAGFVFAKEQLFKEHKFVEKNKVVKIGNDVWIGNNVLIFDGVTIGDGAIIGAGSIVTKDIEPYSVSAGVPAKTIKYRFKKEHIDFLLKFKWWEKDFKWIEKNAYLFDDIEKFYQKYRSNI